MRTTARTVVREYRAPSGELARLEYHPRGGVHKVIGFRGTRACAWPCDTVEAARARWARVLADLTAVGFVPVKGGG